MPIGTGVQRYEGKKEYYSTGSIVDGAYISEGSYTYDHRPSRANRICYKNDLIEAKMQATNKSIIIDEKLDGMLFSTGFFCFRAIINSIEYLKNYINSDYFQKTKDSLCSGVTQKAINDDKLFSILLPLPPLNEQYRINKKITRLLPLIESYRRQEANLSLLETSFEEKLKASILQYAIEGKLVKQDPNDEPASVLLGRIKNEKERLIKEGKIKRDKNESTIYLGDDKNYYGDLPKTRLIIKIGQVLDVYRGGSPRPIESFLTTKQGGINWVKIGDTIQGDKYIVSCKQKIIKDGLSKTRLIQPGDLLLTNSMSFGRPYISKIYGAVHDGWLVFSDFSNSFDKDYLFYLLSSVSILEQFKSTVSGAVVKNLNIDKVKNTNIPLLSKNEQTRIAKRIESIFLTL